MPRQFGVPEELIQDVMSKRKDCSCYEPYLTPLLKEHVIGVNMACQLGPCVDVLFFGDDSFWSRFQDLVLAFRGLRVTCMNKPVKKYSVRVKPLRRIRDAAEGLTTRRDSVVWHKNSGATAINLAAHFGVKQIILLGFDMALDNGIHQHWHKEYAGNPKTVYGTFKMHKKGFPIIAETAKRMGIEILNASPTSTIVEFKKINVSEIL